MHERAAGALERGAIRSPRCETAFSDRRAPRARGGSGAHESNPSRWPIAMVASLVPKTLDAVRVLVVEDDRDTREVVALALAHHGATVRHAATGASAMHVLAEFAPHVVLCDLGLPDVSGLDWLTKLRAM